MVNNNNDNNNDNKSQGTRDGRIMHLRYIPHKLTAQRKLHVKPLVIDSIIKRNTVDDGVHTRVTKTIWVNFLTTDLMAHHC